MSDPGSDPHLDFLQGRIIALELLMRVILTQYAFERFDDPEGAVQQMRSEMFASLQNMERPVGEVEDRVWSAAIDALNLQFDQVARRVQGLLEK